MKVLFLEDEVEWFERTIRTFFSDLDIEILHSSNVEGAKLILDSQEIDYLVIDLSVPVDDESSSSDPSHGLGFFNYCLETYPGIPILVLTAQTTEEAAQRAEDVKSVTVFWDGLERNIIKIRKKRLLDKALSLVEEANEQLRELDSFEVSSKSRVEARIGSDAKRAIQVFGKSKGYLAGFYEEISSGLSGAGVYKVEYLNDRKMVVCNALMKIDDHKLIDEDIGNFNKFLPRFEPGSVPNMFGEIFCGCGRKKAVFYQLASNYPNNLFSIFIESDEDYLVVLEKLKIALSRCHYDKSNRPSSVKDIRQQIFSDDKMDVVYNYIDRGKIESFESNRLSADFSLQHADLHGANVLVSENLDPLIIDFGDIKVAASCLDAVTLELSPYFHPASRDKVGFPTDQISGWFEDSYVDNMTNPKSQRFLRQWTDELSYLSRQKLAVTYSYCIRQLSYEGTNKNFIVSLVEHIFNKYS